MTALTFDAVAVVVVALTIVAVGLALYRPHPREVGLAGGLWILALACGLAWAAPRLPGVLLDGVAIPRVATLGLVTVAVFSVMPQRHSSWGRTTLLLALMGSHLALVTAAGMLQASAAWLLSCGLTWAVLPAGPARRLALPYLALAAAAGGAGLVLDGDAGMALLLLAVVVRLGVFPFHSWVVASYTLAPTSVAVAITAPMAAVALVARAPLGLDGPLGTSVSLALAAAALLTAGLVMVQRELARAVGLLTVSVETVVVIGLLDADEIGHVGGLMMWNLTGLALVGLGLVTVALRSRVGALSLDAHSGLLAQAPVLASVFLLFGLAAVGAPGTADFASEDLVLHGAIAHHPALLLLFISAVSAQGYAVMHLFFRVFYGPPGPVRTPDALPREKVALVALAALLVAVGLAPQVVVEGWAGGVAPFGAEHEEASVAPDEIPLVDQEVTLPL